ncbi:hypothetical protein HK104_001095 [Borealophlyctis nickersoniae]|nr:hypothetical protein HK104_001095 [Borealophlyctis nickersoniae]
MPVSRFTDDDTLTKLNWGFTVLGLVLQIGNIAYATQHAVRRPTTFNLVLVSALIIYALSFVPLLMTTTLTIDLGSQQDSPASPIHYQFVRLDALVRTYTALYGVSTLVYILLVQIRFRVVKSIMPYKNHWDWIFVGVTVTVFSLTTLLFGVILPISPILQSIASAIWSLYGLTVDNVLSFIFIRQLYKTRRNVNATSTNRKVWARVVAALCALCSVTWLCLGLLIGGNVLFADDHGMRTFFFRLAYAFTPLVFSAALVFVYTVRTLMSGSAAATPSSLPSPAAMVPKSARLAIKIPSRAPVMPSGGTSGRHPSLLYNGGERSQVWPSAVSDVEQGLKR